MSSMTSASSSARCWPRRLRGGSSLCRSLRHRYGGRKSASWWPAAQRTRQVPGTPDDERMRRPGTSLESAPLNSFALRASADFPSSAPKHIRLLDGPDPGPNAPRQQCIRPRRCRPAGFPAPSSLSWSTPWTTPWTTSWPSPMRTRTAVPRCRNHRSRMYNTSPAMTAKPTMKASTNRAQQNGAHRRQRRRRTRPASCSSGFLDTSKSVHSADHSTPYGVGRALHADAWFGFRMCLRLASTFDLPTTMRTQGEVAEWSNAAVLKTVVRLTRTGGSNPSLSAT